MSSGIRMMFAMSFLAAAMACGKASSPTTPTPTTVNATIMSGAFTPNPIDISVGSTVVWMNTDNTAHSVVSDSGAFSSGTIAPGGRYSYAFPSARTFGYHDSFNPNMKGTVNVAGSSSPSPY